MSDLRIELELAAHRATYGDLNLSIEYILFKGFASRTTLRNGRNLGYDLAVDDRMQYFLDGSFHRSVGEPRRNTLMKHLRPFA